MKTLNQNFIIKNIDICSKPRNKKRNRLSASSPNHPNNKRKRSPKRNGNAKKSKAVNSMLERINAVKEQNTEFETMLNTIKNANPVRDGSAVDVSGTWSSFEGENGELFGDSCLDIGLADMDNVVFDSGKAPPSISPKTEDNPKKVFFPITREGYSEIHKELKEKPMGRGRSDSFKLRGSPPKITKSSGKSVERMSNPVKKEPAFTIQPLSYIPKQNTNNNTPKTLNSSTIKLKMDLSKLTNHSKPLHVTEIQKLPNEKVQKVVKNINESPNQIIKYGTEDYSEYNDFNSKFDSPFLTDRVMSKREEESSGSTVRLLNSDKKERMTYSKMQNLKKSYMSNQVPDRRIILTYQIPTAEVKGMKKTVTSYTTKYIKGEKNIKANGIKQPIKQPHEGRSSSITPKKTKSYIRRTNSFEVPEKEEGGSALNRHINANLSISQLSAISQPPSIAPTEGPTLGEIPLLKLGNIEDSIYTSDSSFNNMYKTLQLHNTKTTITMSQSSLEGGSPQSCVTMEGNPTFTTYSERPKPARSCQTTSHNQNMLNKLKLEGFNSEANSDIISSISRFLNQPSHKPQTSQRKKKASKPLNPPGSVVVPATATAIPLPTSIPGGETVFKKGKGKYGTYQVKKAAFSQLHFSGAAQPNTLEGGANNPNTANNGNKDNGNINNINNIINVNNMNNPNNKGMRKSNKGGERNKKKVKNTTSKTKSSHISRKTTDETEDPPRKQNDHHNVLIPPLNIESCSNTSQSQSAQSESVGGTGRSQQSKPQKPLSNNPSARITRRGDSKSAKNSKNKLLLSRQDGEFTFGDEFQHFLTSSCNFHGTNHNIGTNNIKNLDSECIPSEQTPRTQTPRYRTQNLRGNPRSNLQMKRGTGMCSPHIRAQGAKTPKNIISTSKNKNIGPSGAMTNTNLDAQSHAHTQTSSIMGVEPEIIVREENIREVENEQVREIAISISMNKPPNAMLTEGNIKNIQLSNSIPEQRGGGVDLGHTKEEPKEEGEKHPPQQTINSTIDTISPATLSKNSYPSSSAGAKALSSKYIYIYIYRYIYIYILK